MSEITVTGTPTGVTVFNTTSTTPAPLGEGRLAESTVVVGDEKLAAAVADVEPHALLTVIWPRNGEGTGPVELLPVEAVVFDRTATAVALELAAASNATSSPLEPPGKGTPAICMLFPQLAMCRERKQRR